MKKTFSREAVIQNALVYYWAALDAVKTARDVIDNCHATDFLKSSIEAVVDISELPIPKHLAVIYAIAVEDAMYKFIGIEIDNADKQIHYVLRKINQPNLDIADDLVPSCATDARYNHAHRGEKHGLAILQKNFVTLLDSINAKDGDISAEFQESDHPLKNGQISPSESLFRSMLLFEEIFGITIEYVCNHATALIKDIAKFKDPSEVRREFESWDALNRAGREPVTYHAERKRHYVSRALAVLQS